MKHRTRPHQTGLLWMGSWHSRTKSCITKSSWDMHSSEILHSVE